MNTGKHTGQARDGISQALRVGFLLLLAQPAALFASDHGLSGSAPVPMMPLADTSSAIQSPTDTVKARALANAGFAHQLAGRYQAAMEAFYAALTAGGLMPGEERNVRIAWADSALASGQPAVVRDALAPYVGRRDPAIESRLQSAIEQLRFRHLDIAYRHLREKNDPAAVEAFKAGFSEAAGTSAHYGDAAYAAKRAGDNTQAAAWFKAALEAQGASELDGGKRFGYQREIEQLQRTWGLVASASYQGGGFSPSASREVGQIGTELYWQPRDVGNHNGTSFQVYGRVYETVYDGVNDQTGGDTSQGALGARYKPWSGYSVVFAAERLLAGGDLARTDWLLRAAGSLGEGGDLDPMAQDWRYWSVYLEAARYLDARQSVVSFESRYGHSWALSGGDIVLTPHLVLSGDQDSLEADELSAGAGPGVSVRTWFGGDRYTAPPSWFDLTLQYRDALTDAERGRGATVRATLWY